MTTAFDDVIDRIIKERYHNQRRPLHSDIVSRRITQDLRESCEAIRTDVASGSVKEWINARTPGARGRKIDLLIGEPNAKGKPDLHKLRICVENKSVWTAHRNTTSRYDDLNDVLQVLHRAKSEAVLVATVMIGVAPRVLNIADNVTKKYKKQRARFNSEVVSKLSSGDQALWKEFDYTISENKPADARTAVEKFRSLPTRPLGQTHVLGYDFVLIVPFHADNVTVPRLERMNDLGIDVDAEYQRMLDQVCRAYTLRFPS
ncbi:MAG: hypothetical protein ACREQR_11495 [Candidatus Binataceae bacterium]